MGVDFRKLIAVCGSGGGDAETLDLAYRTGRAIASNGAVLVCGGLGGVMAESARGAKEAGGFTIGLLPGLDPAAANPYIDLALPTGLGEMRNALIIRSCRAMIALPGGAGTLSEIALGLKAGRRVISLGAWEHIQGPIPASDPEQAAALALGL